MLFVLVQLEEFKKRVIVPESFVHDVNEEHLKSAGASHNAPYSVYWSKQAIGDEQSAPDSTFIPNFNAPIAKAYPPENNLVEACYEKVRIIHYYRK